MGLSQSTLPVFMMIPKDVQPKISEDISFLYRKLTEPESKDVDVKKIDLSKIKRDFDTKSLRTHDGDFSENLKEIKKLFGIPEDEKIKVLMSSLSDKDEKKKFLMFLIRDSYYIVNKDINGFVKIGV
jgi:hypothetical protein